MTRAEIAVRERPILFQGNMVRAILSGSKTQTRRVVKLKGWHTIEERDDGKQWPWMYDSDRDADYWLPCPYGKPGDRLWVRETWQAVNGNDRARHIVTHPAPNRGWIEYAATPRADEPAYKWRPSIHMPRWASRITLEITEVRVERLQDISKADAQAEGIERDGFAWRHYTRPCRFTCTDPRMSYQTLWESINGPGSWEANPWVWCVSFRRIEP